jgi:hypothetical protein
MPASTWFEIRKEHGHTVSQVNKISSIGSKSKRDQSFVVMSSDH